MNPGARLLVVAGEGSGDVLAAPVLSALGVPSFGIGGGEVARAGADVVFDARRIGSMGFGAVARRTPSLLAAVSAVVRATRARRPSAALLVGFSEFNALLSRWLRQRRVRVLWYAPPQVWAWRAGRARRLAESADGVAVLLPFEKAVWADAGARAEYVGHPAAGGAFQAPEGRSPARLLLIPGSRPEEVRAHLPLFLDAARRLAKEFVAFVVRAPSLDPETARWLDDRGRTAGVTVVDGPLSRLDEHADVAIAASGTATLECAARGVPPVIVYRTGAFAHALARRLVRVRHIGLPNLVLGRRAFPELVQSGATCRAVASAVRRTFATRHVQLAACRETRAALEAGLDARTPGERVASMLAPWLG